MVLHLCRCKAGLTQQHRLSALQELRQARALRESVSDAAHPAEAAAMLLECQQVGTCDQAISSEHELCSSHGASHQNCCTDPAVSTRLLKTLFVFQTSDVAGICTRTTSCWARPRMLSPTRMPRPAKRQGRRSSAPPAWTSWRAPTSRAARRWRTASSSWRACCSGPARTPRNGRANSGGRPPRCCACTTAPPPPRCCCRIRTSNSCSPASVRQTVECPR